MEKHSPCVCFKSILNTIAEGMPAGNVFNFNTNALHGCNTKLIRHANRRVDYITNPHIDSVRTQQSMEENIVLVPNQVRECPFCFWAHSPGCSSLMRNVYWLSHALQRNAGRETVKNNLWYFLSPVNEHPLNVGQASFISFLGGRN